ncbi:MAG: AMP-binding protein, partial [Candidatus Hydrogenedentes bacterium]|nr:AMP-binding protein [Candidatus Hydrogenedentota bacterium]
TQTEVTEPLEVRVTSVGHPLPGVEVRIVDALTGADVPEGAQGELWTRGHNVMLGYYDKPEETAAAITPDGWLRTGDLAVRTPDGHYRITGRSKDVIIRGGENVYPREVEEFLLSHPKVRDVQVVGLPDTKYGEQVSAWVIPEDASLTEDELRAWCAGKIAHFKIPKYIQFTDAYPLTVTGKVQKFRLREMGIDRFQLQEAARIETA